MDQVLLPPDILFDIVRALAASSLDDCYNLCLVSRSFKAWAQPFIFDRIDRLTGVSARKLQQLLLIKSPQYLSKEVHVKSISFAENVSTPLAKAILAQASHRIFAFSSRSVDPDIHPGKYLPFIRSPYLKRLSLVWDRPPPDNNVILCGDASPYNCIPVSLMVSLTHFIAYTPHTSCRRFRGLSWGSLHNAVGERLLVSSTGAEQHSVSAGLANSGTTNWESFQRLTHVAFASHCFMFATDLASVAHNLQYIVILEDSSDAGFEKSRLALLDKVRKNRDRRIVVIDVEPLRRLNCLIDSGRQHEFWKKAEKLVSGGYLSEWGDVYDC